MLFKLGEKVSDEDILKLLKELDIDNDGAIGFDDLL
jgi:Ca2+-binding EF-hand superfamily protein